jgi:uncharacterized protein
MRVRGYPPGSLCWVELVSPDLAGAAAFYGDLLGWSVAGDPADGRLDFRLGGLVTAGATAAAGGRAAWVPFMSTEDAATTATAATTAGGRLLAAPHPVGDRGQRAICADPEGTVFGLWQRAGFGGTQVQREPGTPSWGELWTRDAAGAVTFYKEVFGWSDRPGEFSASVDYHEFYLAGRTVAGLIEMTDAIPASLPARWGTTIEVRECGAVAARCVELGGMVVVPPMFVEVGTAAYLVDPQGALFGIFEPIPELTEPTLR